MATETNGWFTTAEEDAARALQHKKKYELLQTIPEYRKSERDRIWLCDFVSSILFIEAHEFSFERPKNLKQSDYGVVSYQMGRAVAPPKKPLTYDADGYETKAYRDFCRDARRLDTILRHYSSHYRCSEWNAASRGREYAEEDFGEYNMGILRKASKRGAASFDVGSSLYLYQQMHDRQLVEEPSLGKSAWLVKNAPLRKPVPDTPSARGKWELIQEQWRKNVENAHYWAALVATTGSPLRYTDNLLLDFICEADVDQFQRLARTFYDFRQRATVSRVANGRRTYLKQIPSDVPDDLAAITPCDPLDIPNPLEDYQWAALSHYRKR